MISKEKDRHRYRSIFCQNRSETNKENKNRYAKLKHQRYRNKHEISFCESIDIVEERSDVLKIVENINLLYGEGKTDVLLNFSKTKKITAAAMLLIYASIKNIYNLNKKIRFKCYGKMNNRVKQVLKQIGVFDLCKQSPKIKITRSDVVNWRVCSGNNAMCEKFDDIIIEKHRKLLPEDAELYAGCIEATKNVINHAYDRADELSRKVDENEKWWSFSQIKDGILQVYVCDLGLTIPHTLPKKRPELFSIICDTFKKQLRRSNVEEKPKDSLLIDGATSENMSRTKKIYRGNGLHKIAAIAKVKGGALTIHSRKGFVHYESDASPILYDYNKPVKGTIIAWSLPLKESV